MLRWMMVASLALPAALFVYLAWASYRSTWRVADERIEASLGVLNEHAQRMFQTGELVGHEVAELTRGMSDDEIRRDEARLHARLAAMSEPIPIIHSLWIMDAEGRPLVSDYLYPAPRSGSVLDRDYFRAQLDPATGIYIGSVNLPRFSDAEPFFSMSRRRPMPDGSFGGVITVSLRPADFESFYAQLARTSGSYFGMIRADGALLARFPEVAKPEERVGLTASRLASEAAGGRERGSYTAVAQLDGIERRFGFRKLDRLPIYLVAGTETAAIRSEWLRGLASHLAFGLPASLVIFGVLWMAMQRTRRLYDEAERREAAEAALRQSQRLEAIGQLTGGIAHDFNNLLMVISGGADRLRRRITDPQQLRMVDMIATAAERGESLTRQLLSFSRRQALAPVPIDLAQRIPELEEILQRSIRGDITVRLDLPPHSCPVTVDPAEFELALINLAVNARDAMPSGGELSIRLEQQHLEGESSVDGLTGEFLSIAVADTGTGIPPDILSRVFEPFFTTKEIDRGTGLGLSQVYGFARQSGGTVTIRSEPNRGTTVTIYLPCSRGAAAPRSAPADAVAAVAPGLRVLVVEDNASVAEVTSAYLAELEADATIVAGGAEALSRIRAGEAFDLVFSDILMPGGLTGLDLAREVRRLRPGLPIVLATGYSSSAEQAVREGYTVLRKPFSLDQLRSAVSGALEEGSEQPVRSEAAPLAAGLNS
ncbi:hybrid sensor histidine kinase/response regulator [Propylenella binzhouense]|uniref:histidine kinase n=1 Tax=Propylenella binzhouense TaxID=2555902 RepID=A0A964T437_9HYPH|nr:hybrid sensor histidine kinase/response regulator [Propylenella binzhouense]MYZ48030.1 hybrid sensor histidine kinase/response regulator [Propylenella binzhouense]